MGAKKTAKTRSAKGMSRRSLPPSTRQLVLLEAGYRCSNPVCRHVLTLEVHHIDWVRAGGGNDPSNLLALCGNCHSLHTYGHIPEAAIRAWKAMLASLNNPHRGNADLLLLLVSEESRQQSLPPDQRIPFRFSGDSLHFLAGLITSGLVEITNRFTGASWFGGGAPTFEITLTDSGRTLVEAWKSGDPERVRSALGNSGAA
jgi:hypothetical protein